MNFCKNIIKNKMWIYAEVFTKNAESHQNFEQNENFEMIKSISTILKFLISRTFSRKLLQPSDKKFRLLIITGMAYIFSFFSNNRLKKLDLKLRASTVHFR